MRYLYGCVGFGGGLAGVIIFYERAEVRPDATESNPRRSFPIVSSIHRVLDLIRAFTGPLIPKSGTRIHIGYLDRMLNSSGTADNDRPGGISNWCKSCNSCVSDGPLNKEKLRYSAITRWDD